MKRSAASFGGGPEAPVSPRRYRVSNRVARRGQAQDTSDGPWHAAETMSARYGPPAPTVDRSVTEPWIDGVSANT